MSNIMMMGKGSDFLGAWDLYDVPGKSAIFTIKSIEAGKAYNPSTSKEEPVTICRFVEPYKPMILTNKNKKILSRLFKTADDKKLSGKKIKIGFESKKCFGEMTDVLRISSKMVSQVGEAAKPAPICHDCKKEVEPLGKRSAQELADYTKEKYGVPLCPDCAKKRADATQVETEQTDEDEA
jgi:hypothetical protein